MRRRRIKTRNLPRIRRVLSSLEVPPLFVPHFRGVSSGDAQFGGLPYDDKRDKKKFQRFDFFFTPKYRRGN